MRVLPPELIDEVASYLDRTSLLVFVRVSTQFWDIGAPKLYRRMSVGEPELQQLLVYAGGVEDKHGARGTYREARGSRACSDMFDNRIRRAFSWVEYLELQAPFHTPVIRMLQGAASTVPNVPLFPRVKQLNLGTSIRESELCAAEDGVLLFNEVDVCLIDEHTIARYCECLPAKEHRMVTHVDMGCITIRDINSDLPYPSTCTLLRIFSAWFYQNAYDLELQPTVISELEDFLVAGGYPPRTVHLCFLVRAVFDPETAAEAEESINRMFLALEQEGWTPSPERRVQISFSDTLDSVRAPCPVCGRSQAQRQSP